MNWLKWTSSIEVGGIDDQYRFQSRYSRLLPVAPGSDPDPDHDHDHNNDLGSVLGATFSTALAFALVFVQEGPGKRGGSPVISGVFALVAFVQRVRDETFFNVGLSSSLGGNELAYSMSRVNCYEYLAICDGSWTGSCYTAVNHITRRTLVG